MDRAAIQARLKADAALPASKRSFFLRPPGRAKGRALMIHGFSACPYELRDAAAFLQKKGYAVYAPRLAGHGLDTAAFNAQGRADWLADAEAALAAMQGGGPLDVIGHSMGGVLAAILAARHPGAVRRLVLAAPAFRLADPLAPFSTFALVRAFIPELHFPAQHADSDQWTRDYSSSRVAELLRLGREGRPEALRLRGPLLLLQSRIDPLVSRPFNEALFPQIPSQEKELLIYEAAEHNVLHRYNPRQKEVFQRIAAFLR